jgi:hypothetical protein
MTEDVKKSEPEATFSLDDFLTSKSMLTPAIAGTAVTTITAVLVSNFGLPGKWSVLILSLIFGLLTLADKSVPILKRLVLYLLNSTTILVFAIGLNEAGMAASGYDDCPVPRTFERGVEKPKDFFQPWL